MASRDEFEAAVDGDARAYKSGMDNPVNQPAMLDARAALLALWPEPVACDGCDWENNSAGPCAWCRRMARPDNYQPKERADAQ